MTRLSDWVTSALNAAAAFWAFVLAFVIVADVIGRTMGYPVQGTAEIVANSIVAIVFLQFPLAIDRGYFLRATVLHQVMPRLLRGLLDVVASVLGLFLFYAIATGSWSDMLTGFRIGEFEGEGALRVPVYPVRAIIFGMSILSMVVYALLICRTIWGLFQPADSAAATPKTRA